MHSKNIYTPLFMFIHLPLIYFAPPPRLLIDFKIANDLPIFASYYVLLLFLLPDWLTFGHMTISLI